MACWRVAGLGLMSFAAACGQTALTGAIRGLIADEAGGRIEGARVEVESASAGVKLETLTGPGGGFQFFRLKPAHDYRMLVRKPAFAVWERYGLPVLSGETQELEVRLAVAGRQETIEIRAGGEPAASAEISQSVETRRLAALPSNGRFLNRFALVDPHVRNTGGQGGDGSTLTRLSINGAIFRETQYRLDGNTNYDTLFNNTPLQRISLSAVQEFRVLTGQFNAEHGSTSTGLILTTTKSGGDEWHGEALAFARPSGIQARPPLASRHTPNQLLQGGASLGGPIATGRTHVFANFERLAQQRGSFITSPAPAVYVGRFEDTLALARLDHRSSDRHWTALRLNGHRDSNTNPNDRVGGLVQPGAATRSLAQSAGSQLIDTVAAGRAVSEFRAGYVNAVPPASVPLAPKVGIVRPGYSIEGASSFSSLRTEIYQAAEQVSLHAGSHSVQFGGDFIRRKVRDFSYDQFGTYTFAGGPPQPAEVPLLYTQRFGVARLSYGQTQWAGFVQDTWRALPRLTLSLGLRYDWQSLLDDGNNLGPRAGFAWDALGDGSTVLRGGFGLYYDQPFFHGLTQRFLLNGLEAPFASYTFAAGDPGFPAFPQSLPTVARPSELAPQNLVIRAPELLSPYTSQISLGVERRLAGNWVATVSFLRSLTVKQFVHYNRNPPAPFPRSTPAEVRSVPAADRTRPLYDPARGVSIYQGVPVRDVRETVNGGSASYHALDLGVARRFAGRYHLEARYVLSAALNNVTDDHLGANPNEWSDAGRAERAVSDYAQRHRLVAHGSLMLPWQTQFSGMGTIASGLPVNALTGVDSNGDGTIVDRPAGFRRNDFRGSSHASMDLALAKTVAIGERARLELRAEGFNLWNHRNLYRFNNIYGTGSAPRAGFLAPIGGVANVDPGRQFTFGAKFLF